MKMKKNYSRREYWEIWCIFSIVLAFISGCMAYMEDTSDDMYFWLNIVAMVNLIVCLLFGIRRKKRSDNPKQHY